jgi:hypothetical protein
MTKLQVKIVNCETGEEIVRDMNDAEIAAAKVSAANDQATQDAENATAIRKAALLEKLGITADEAVLLLK